VPGGASITGRHGADPSGSSLVGFLDDEGAGELRHAAGRSLLDHLLETCAIVRRWGQPEWLAHAALLHSVYGTDRYSRQLIDVSRRAEISELAGARAERIAYLFSAVPRGPLLAGTYRWARVPLDGALEAAPTKGELDALVLLHMANLAEQARARGGAPGIWLAKVRDWAELLVDSETIVLPLFLAQLAGLSAAEEELACRNYGAGVGSADSLAQKADRLALAASACPVIAEPRVWLAYLAVCRSDVELARRWAHHARERLLRLGAAWDKRLSFEQWSELAEALGDPRAQEICASATIAGHPGELLARVMREAALRSPRGDRRPGAKPTSPQPGPGRRRFHRYIERLAEGDASAFGGIYPELSGEPWLHPSDFPLVAFLESHFAAIREEVISLDPWRFHRESERIKRSGDWDVAFFYERGRRHDEVCEACPVTTRGIEGHGTVRTMAGLIYVSRMRAGTHIDAHHGPTNLRVRCHLGITVPEGDCAIRVGDVTRRWEEGKCLVFDDHFEHEAWNHTAEERIVLIADLWHPGLSPTEVSLLEGLHRYAAAHARRLNRYWAANAAAARGGA